MSLYETLVYKDFNFDDKTIICFTEGECCHLALRLYQHLLSLKRFEKDKVVLSYVECFYPDRQISRDIHWCVKIEDRYIDVMGIWEKGALLRWWYEQDVYLSSNNKNNIYKIVDCIKSIEEIEENFVTDEEYEELAERTIHQILIKLSS